ncbi:SPOR domain-containing protein [Limnohabitans sp. Hippo3]|uniref:SPOR domain-containing protein n=1 Tax=Limnohabitans sp. Hippo3 TaxID=1597956 RepID=UPI000D37C4F7|nr:SPOR domain-containing protein [Limnohabitans sp. Hippo3]PUE39540.1 SPOR domain-containing protein [Limnohabitans sp. Hippo3]
MAFFKFRFPGQTASGEAVTAGPNENIEVVRRRARHRLMGAVVLVLVAVVGFPLLFDTQPRPVAVDTPIVIPDRQSTPPLSSGTPVPASQAPAKPLLPASEPVTAQASLDAREEVVPAPAPTSPAPQAEPAKVAPPVAKAPDKEPVVKQNVPAAAPVKADKPAPVKPKDDGDKAQALLEGKQSVKASAGRVVIQVGAFSDPAKVREVRSKLEQAGVKTYTQMVERDGKSTTRIRVGPFETREEADKVAARIRKLDLPVSFLKI